MKTRLTAKAIAKLAAPDPNGKQQAYWDTELTGFGVVCSGVSKAKSFVVQHELSGRRTRRVTLGPCNVLSIEQARERARAVLADLYADKDPKTGRRGALTLRSTLETYLTARKDLRPKSRDNYRLNIEKYLTAWLDRPLREITADMVEARHTNLQAEIEAKGRYDGQATANEAMGTLRALWNFALEREPGLGPNPVSRLRRQWYPKRQRERMVPLDKLPSFYAAVTALPNPIQRDYVLLLLFTGLRRGDAASLTWEDIDFRQRTFRIPGSRTKSGRRLDLPMTDVVHDIFVTRRTPGKERFVFPSNGPTGHITQPNKIFDTINRACGIRVSAHDLRRVFITVAESCDISVMALKALVNHQLGAGITEGYIKMSAERLREPAQRVCDRMKELCGIAPIADVHKLRGR
jgi:integrase